MVATSIPIALVKQTIQIKVKEMGMVVIIKAKVQGIQQVQI